ncbi:DUF1595 domain-containing protein [Sorangium sp. So ce315]|uniref:DUF1595 domain-containing protein n=1 Tax=Sorangium sp. So ce315 TaxID=3133299 RepID=UPI003F632AB8
MNRISRRRFAAGLGAGLLAARFLGRNNHLRADGGTARNLVVFFSPSGTHHHLWRPQCSGSSFSFPAGSILEPLAAHRSDRPLTQDDRSRYMELYRSVKADEGFAGGFQAMIAAALQSPYLLYPRRSPGRRASRGASPRCPPTLAP